MKRFFRVVAVLLCAVTLLCTLSACNKDNGYFGYFQQNGYRLHSFATKNITANDALNMLSGGSKQAKVGSSSPVTPIVNSPKALVSDDDEVERAKQEAIQIALAQSNRIVVTTQFFKEGEDDMQKEVSEQMGTTVSDFLNKDIINSAVGLSIRNLLLTTERIEQMEVENAEFKNSAESINALYNNLYTFHTDKQNHLIVQMHYFVEIPANTMGGGISCYYIQDTEIMYDILTSSNLNKSIARISKWQTSLGVVISTAGDSIHEGFVYQVDVDWMSKDATN